MNKLEAIADLVLEYAVAEDETFEDMDALDIVERVCKVLWPTQRQGFAWNGENRDIRWGHARLIALRAANEGHTP